MPKSALPTVPGTYAALRSQVTWIFIQGQAEIEALRVRVYWQTGKLLKDYLEIHPGEARRRSGVLERLAEDLNLERSLFYRLLQFAEAFPEVVPGRQLTWTHYRALLAVPDSVKRRELAREAARSAWPARRLRLEAGRLKSPRRASRPSGGPALTEPARGRLGVHYVVALKDVSGAETKAVDLGFYIYKPLPTEAGGGGFAAGETVIWNEAERKWSGGGAKEDVYHYIGHVERVVDGDTLLVHVDLGFGFTRRQYLRLRGLNAPPLSEPAGAEARDVLLKQFEASPAVYFKSRFTDRYDRYIADAWAGVVYLNNLLLKEGLAERAYQ